MEYNQSFIGGRVIWGSVGTAKDNHVLFEAGQVLAQLLVLIVLAFVLFRPQLYPSVLPNDVLDAGEEDTWQVRRGPGSVWGRGRTQCAGWALTWTSLPTGPRTGPI